MALTHNEALKAERCVPWGDADTNISYDLACTAHDDACAAALVYAEAGAPDGAVEFRNSVTGVRAARVTADAEIRHCFAGLDRLAGGGYRLLDCAGDEM